MNTATTTVKYTESTTLDDAIAHAKACALYYRDLQNVKEWRNKWAQVDEERLEVLDMLLTSNLECETRQELEVKLLKVTETFFICQRNVETYERTVELYRSEMCKLADRYMIAETE